MGLIPEETIQQVIERCDIVETVSTYIPLKRAGRNFKANCPFHSESTPSFVVSPDKQIYHCFGCGAGGNVVSFVMRQERLEFPEAVKWLAQKVNVTIPEDFHEKDSQKSHLRQEIIEINAESAQYFNEVLFSDKSEEVQSIRTYLKNRGVSLDTARDFQIGYAYDSWDGLIRFFAKKDIDSKKLEQSGLVIARDSKDGYYDRFRGRVIFPILDVRGHVRAFGARALEKDATAKYINSPETPVYTKGQHLYGFHLAKQAIGQSDVAIVVEGYMDCIIPYQYGVRNIVASLGTALTLDQIRLLRRYTKNIVMLFDMDKAGQAALLRSCDSLIEENFNVRVATLKEGHDPDSFIRDFGVDAFNDRIKQAQSIFEYKLRSLISHFGQDTVEAKAEVSRQMLLTISKFENAVVRSSYVQRLADYLKIEEQALRTEFGKLNIPLAQQNLKVADVSVKKNQHPAERSFLRLILEYPDLIAQAKSEITIETFQGSQIQNVISKIYQLSEQDKLLDVSKVLNSFDNQEIHQMISELMMDESLVVGDKDRMFSDCIFRLRNDRLKVLRKDLLQRMKNAEVAGDSVQVNELKEQFNKLLKR